MTDNGTGLAIALGALVVVAFIVALSVRFARRRRVRRALVRLISRREGILAAHLALQEAVVRLSAREPEQLLSFAQYPDDEERLAIVELCRRMEVFVEDLRHTRLPKPLWHTATMMGQSALVIGKEACRIAKPESVRQVLEGLTSLDMDRVQEAVSGMRGALDRQLAAYKVDDPSVYGGGFHI